MDFFKPQQFPLNFITVVFVVTAVILNAHIGGIAGIGCAFLILLFWALTSYVVEKYFLKKRSSLSKYALHAFGMTTLLVFIILILGVVLGQPFNSDVPVNRALENCDVGHQKYGYTKILQTQSNTFYCSYLCGTESLCELKVADTNGNLKDLNIAADTTYEMPLPSPDKKYLLVTLEQQAVVVDTSTLSQRTIVQAPAAEALGTYDAFPSFTPASKWLGNNEVQISFFDQNAKVDAAPLRTQVFNIR